MEVSSPRDEIEEIEAAIRQIRIQSERLNFGIRSGVSTQSENVVNEIELREVRRIVNRVLVRASVVCGIHNQSRSSRLEPGSILRTSRNKRRRANC